MKNMVKLKDVSDNLGYGKTMYKKAILGKAEELFPSLTYVENVPYISIEDAYHLTLQAYRNREELAYQFEQFRSGELRKQIIENIADRL